MHVFESTSSAADTLSLAAHTQRTTDIVPASAPDLDGPSNPKWTILSGQTLSPITQLPTYHKPYVPGIINHYIHNLTIPIPELDGSTTVPLFRAAWLPVVVHDPLIFQIVVLFAATHYATYAAPSEYQSLHVELLSLKQSALSSLIRKVQSEQPTQSHKDVRPSSDTLIAAAAKMASFEAIFGAVEAVSHYLSIVLSVLTVSSSICICPPSLGCCVREGTSLRWA